MVKGGLGRILVFLFPFLVPATLPAVPSGQVITWADGAQGIVEFEGDEHAEEGYKCESCHPSLFQTKKGSAKITMDLLNKGQFCGSCHNGKAAFSTSDPKECHECHKKTKEHHDRKDKHHD